MKGQRHLVSTLAAALLLAAIGAAPASAGTKPFTLNITPPTAKAHQQVTFTATFAVPSNAQQQLGSPELAAPAGPRPPRPRRARGVHPRVGRRAVARDRDGRRGQGPAAQPQRAARRVD